MGRIRQHDRGGGVILQDRGKSGRDGRTYSGTYKVDRQLLTVTNYGKKAGQVVPRKPREALAQELLQELVREE